MPSLKDETVAELQQFLDTQEADFGLSDRAQQLVRRWLGMACISLLDSYSSVLYSTFSLLSNDIPSFVVRLFTNAPGRYHLYVRRMMRPSESLATSSSQVLRQRMIQRRNHRNMPPDPTEP
jgi:hypothetical protein